MAEWVRSAIFNTKVVGSNTALVKVGGVQCHLPPQVGTDISLPRKKRPKADLWELGWGRIKEVVE